MVLERAGRWFAHPGRLASLFLAITAVSFQPFCDVMHWWHTDTCVYMHLSYPPGHMLGCHEVLQGQGI